ncbi:MAG: peptide chain release factor 1 [Candidatus Omnitrophota bacterium]|nr:peptide chain release factor 1 [Candidatus Omnitrophota bacterium]
MFDEILKKEVRLKELESLISDPDVISRTELYQKYAKEHSEISEIVKKYHDYKKVEKEIGEVMHVLSAKHDPDFMELAESELSELKSRKEVLIRDIEDMMCEKDPDSDKGIIMEIRAGTGGVEASLFAAELYRMYARYATKKGWKTETLSSSMSEKNGFKEVVFSVSGRGVYSFFKYESGTHRVQRVPDTEASGRIHTSAVTVAVLPEAEDVEVNLKQEDLKIDVYRSGGHGGQSVNTTDSAVRITHLPTGLVVICQDERSQHKNKVKAMRVLNARLFDKIKSEQQARITKDRKKQVGSGDRSEKIRTYNFPDRRITDHRINLTLYRLPEIMEGDLDELIAGLKDAERKLRLGKKDEDK